MLMHLFEQYQQKWPLLVQGTHLTHPPPNHAMCPWVLSKTGGGFGLLLPVSRSERPGFWGHLGLGAYVPDNTGAFKATQRIPGCQFASKQIYSVCLICRAIGMWKWDLTSNEP